MSDPASSPTFRVLRECDDQWSAVAIQTLLSSDKIQSHLTGTDAATALGLGGAPTDVLVRIQVEEGDYERAVEILRKHDELIENGQPWTCPRCSEPNDATFEFCWNCKAHNEHANDEQTNDHEIETKAGANRSANLEALVDPMTIDRAQLSQRPFSTNPYQPAEVGVVVAKVGLIEDTDENAAHYEAAVRQALLISIVATLLVPPLLFPVVCFMLLRLPGRPASVPYPAIRIRAAWIFAALSLALGFFFFRLGLVPFSLFWG